MPEYKYYEDYEIGEKQVTSSRTMTEADIRLFIGCSDNTHPVHVDEEYCKRHPAIKGCIVHGVLTLGVADGFMAREIGQAKCPPYITDMISPGYISRCIRVTVSIVRQKLLTSMKKMTVRRRDMEC